MLKKIIRVLKGETDRLSEESISMAIEVIEKHGMKAHFYFAGIGNRNNNELSNALDTLSVRCPLETSVQLK